ncbi:MAG: N-6 DNA methylase [Planctomycetes bacterium]|nr:N-6 DNA methylase [Planctomycetota bacterium]
MDAVEVYFKEMWEVRSTGGGVAETSYYPALLNLLNALGGKLKPKVRCVSQLQDTGAGSPDFGLFSASQFKKQKDMKPLQGQKPERGVIEAKPTNDDSWVTAEEKQVTKYWGNYGQVLVTNYRDFVFVGKDENLNVSKLETFRICDSEEKFWEIARQPQKGAKEHGERLTEYLKRVMKHSAVISDPEELAWFLASHAKEARGRIAAAGDQPGLAALRKGLEEALGLKFDGEKGEHFFQATLIQTLFYGVFSSWVLWAKSKEAVKGTRFSWHDAAWNLHVPMIASLFAQIAMPEKLEPLGIVEVLDWTGMVLNRVDRRAFFQKFEEEHAVLYFYEPFLKAYDPELRKELGVWYTPPEIVKYQVERVDQVLRSELDIADGLADESVYVLDPCCGTGTYLVEVLQRIHRTLEEKGSDALTAQQLKKAAMKRVFGFEILPAPFVISHLQLGLLLKNMNAPLSDKKNERVGVYLTNALTGWEPPKKPKDQLPLPFPGLEEERDAAEKVKQKAPILVVLGNPPYNAFAGTSPEEEEGLVEVYKGVHYIKTTAKRRGSKPKRIRKYRLRDPIEEGGWGIKKFNMDELYVRFFRIAERRIMKGGKGVVSFISNHSWVSDPSYVILREQLLQSFNKLWIENMHGNRKISEYAPDGKTSQTIFAIPGFSVGIQQGVVTSLWVKTGEEKKNGTIVRFRDDIDAAKAVERRKDLLATLDEKDFDERYVVAEPTRKNRYSFRPGDVEKEYLEWPTLLEMCTQKPFVGAEECRGGALIDYEREKLTERLEVYFDDEIKWDIAKESEPLLARESTGYDPLKTRKKIIKKEGFSENNLLRIVLRPFDNRWCYHTVINPLWNRSRPKLREQLWDDNIFLVSRFNCNAKPEGIPMFITTSLLDKQTINRNPGAIPFWLKQEPNKTKDDDNMTDSMFDEGPSDVIKANLSEKAREYLRVLGFGDPDEDKDVAELIWMHSLTIGYSGAYLEENADGIRGDWPRIPLPDSKESLIASARLGKEVAGLLDTESGVKGVTEGAIRKELKCIGGIKRVGGGALNPDKGELDVTSGWGHAGKGGVCMPGQGKVVERPCKGGEVAWGEVCPVGSDETLNIYLNEVAYFSNVPRVVWDYHIGGYQVIKKWLSYREKSMLGRGLNMEEALYIQEMVRRIGALLLLGPALDENYKQVKENTHEWARE